MVGKARGSDVSFPVQRCLLQLGRDLLGAGLCSLKGRLLAMPVKVVCLITTVDLDFLICSK